MDYDSDSREYFEMIEELIEEGSLVRDSAPHGAAKQCHGQGYESLKPDQKRAYDYVFLPLLKKKLCPVPGCDGRVHQGSRLCSSHQSQVDKD